MLCISPDLAQAAWLFWTWRMGVQHWKFRFGSEGRFALTERGGGLWHSSWLFVELSWLGWLFFPLRNGGYKKERLQRKRKLFEGLTRKFPLVSWISREPKAMTRNDTCSQDINVTYVNATARRCIGPGWKNLVKTPRWDHESSDLNEIYEIQKVIWEAKLFQSFYLYRKYSQTGCTVMCLPLKAKYRVQMCSLDGHPGLSSVPVPCQSILIIRISFSKNRL